MPTLANLAKIGMNAHHDRLKRDAVKSGLAVSQKKASEYKKYERDPIGYIEARFGGILTDEQKEICLSLLGRKITCVQASHGVGKSYLSALLALWFVEAVEGRVITTAPTARQVGEIIWGEIRKRNKAFTVGGRYTSSPYHKLVLIEDKAWAIGFAAEDRNTNAFQGLHAEKLLIIIDEACGVTEEIWGGASSCLTGDFNMMLAIGNPVTVDNPFQLQCSRHAIHIPVWGHPNVNWAYEKHPDGIHRLKPEIKELIVNPENGEILGQEQWPDDPRLQKDIIPGAVSIAWIEDIARPHGESSGWWLSRVEGRFPLDAENSLVPRSWFREARHRYDSNPEYWDNLAHVQPHRGGMDIGDGSDPHALAVWRGPTLYTVNEYQTQGDRLDLARAAGKAIRWLAETNGRLAIDSTGVGSGVDSMVLEAIHQNKVSELILSVDDVSDALPSLNNCGCSGIKWSRKADPSGYNPDSFTGAGALKYQQCFALRRAFELGELAIAPLGDLETKLEDELCGIYWEELSDGKLKVEPKAKTKKRLKRSPNLADAVVMGYSENCGHISADMLAIVERETPKEDVVLTREMFG